MPHRCCCALVGPNPALRDAADRCPAVVASNDQPFCDACEAKGHPVHPWQQPQLELVEVDRA